jgi:hypothetical protein
VTTNDLPTPEAKNLSGKYPNVTTQAILDGLKSGKSIGQTLQDLGHEVPLEAECRAPA